MGAWGNGTCLTWGRGDGGGGPGASSAPSPCALQGPLESPPFSPPLPLRLHTTHSGGQGWLRGRAEGRRAQPAVGLWAPGTGTAACSRQSCTAQWGRGTIAVARRFPPKKAVFSHGCQTALPASTTQTPFRCPALCPQPGTPPHAATKAPCMTPSFITPYRSAKPSALISHHRSTHRPAPAAPQPAAATAAPGPLRAPSSPRPPRGVPTPPGSAPTAALSAAQSGRCRCWRVDQNQKRKQR